MKESHPNTASPEGETMTELLHTEATNGSQTSPPMLSVRFDDRASLCVLSLAGQLTQTSVAALDAQVDQIGCSQCKHLILDVAELTGLDPIGTRVLVGLDVYVRALGARLTITGASGAVAEALARTPLDPGDSRRAAAPTMTVGYPGGARAFALPNLGP
jgi:anti-anti-sigma factor